MEKVIITRPILGICHMQACVEKDATDDEILEVCNKENPSGTTNGWTNIIRWGDGAPVQCEDNPDRLHVLAVC